VSTARAVDHHLHGLATVRLVDASPANDAAVARQLGTVGRPADGTADVTVRFVDRAVPRGRLRLVGLGGAGHTDDAFVLLRRGADGTAMAELPLERIGHGLEITCERRLTQVPMLVPLLNAAMLAKGVAPLHASAFVWGGHGVAAAGWRTSGKTEALLSFMAQGALAIADEWVYVTPDRRLHGVPEPVRLQDWHLDQLPEHRAALRPKQRARLGSLAVAGAVARAGGRVAGPMGRLAGAVAARSHVDVLPARLFGSDRWVGTGRLDRVFLLATAEARDVRVEQVPGELVARRMVYAHQHHRLGLISAYFEQRFAFPERVSTVLEEAAELERDLLLRVLGGVDAHVVEHPHPVDISRLFEAMRPFCA
jgi:hypothetical protein